MYHRTNQVTGGGARAKLSLSLQRANVTSFFHLELASAGACHGANLFLPDLHV